MFCAWGISIYWLGQDIILKLPKWGQLPPPWGPPQKFQCNLSCFPMVKLFSSFKTLFLSQEPLFWLFSWPRELSGFSGFRLLVGKAEVPYIPQIKVHWPTGRPMRGWSVPGLTFNIPYQTRRSTFKGCLIWPFIWTFLRIRVKCKYSRYLHTLKHLFLMLPKDMSIWTSYRLSEQGAGRGDSQTSIVFSLVMTTDGLELKCEQVRSISSLPRMLWGLRMGRLGHSWSYQTCKWGSIKVPTVDNFAYERRDWGGKKGMQSLTQCGW